MTEQLTHTSPTAYSNSMDDLGRELAMTEVGKALKEADAVVEKMSKALEGDAQLRARQAAEEQRKTPK